MTIFRLYRIYKPMRFFGWIAIFLAIISLGLFVPVLQEYLATGLVPRFPTLIVSSVMMLSAFLSVVCGLILETQNAKDRQFFELQMNVIKMLQNK